MQTNTQELLVYMSSCTETTVLVCAMCMWNVCVQKAGLFSETHFAAKACQVQDKHTVE